MVLFFFFLAGCVGTDSGVQATQMSSHDSCFLDAGHVTSAELCDVIGDCAMASRSVILTRKYAIVVCRWVLLLLLLCVFFDFSVVFRCGCDD